MRKKSKQFQGSKSAARCKDFMQRQYLSKLERERLEKINDPNATMEEMAEAMGIKLK